MCIRDSGTLSASANQTYRNGKTKPLSPLSNRRRTAPSERRDVYKRQHPQFEEQIAVVKQTLQEIGAGDKPVYLVFNKVVAYMCLEADCDPKTACP